ncbi:ATP-binding protein [Gordonia hankookensis]|uniref:ATP-binding protein n=1 Tax=Gordonia hankookensis TaxID=589403 RepID=A0ABR7WCP5_9ACTN|nr:ATP-binding protein [Gordonia hankookensis]MBD1320570.1 ATP-binding protein [Gordonia hankookensis]
MSSDADEVIGRIKLDPDPGLVKSLGANHTLESAIADLIDNSLDADATHVAVRLLTEGDRLVQVEVVDNGTGMGQNEIDAAMTIGRQRDYAAGDLGHFGMGLKAASFGHGDVLTVWSSKRAGEPQGRRIRRGDYSRDFTCEVLSSGLASQYTVDRERIVRSGIGTTVIWSELRSAYRGNSSDEAQSWLSKRNENLRAHLGVTYHRLLSSNRLSIEVLVAERAEAKDSLGIPVLPVDPFGYRTPGHPAYPKVLVATAGGTEVEMVCHIWPAKSDVTGYRIAGNPGVQYQGFYIYRNDRLLQVGGWSDTAAHTPARQLARIVVDDSDAIGQFLTMNPEKSGLKFEPAFHDAIDKARSSDGTTFLDYIQDAETVFAESNKRRRRRKPVIQPGKGFAPALHKRIGAELSYLHGDSLAMKWTRLPAGEFIDVDFHSKTVWLNSRYRSLFAPGGGRLNDSPMLKSLLFLLTHGVFEGQVLGARDKDEIALWTSVLGAAVVAEEQMRDG